MNELMRLCAAPERIILLRAKGFRLPSNAVSVARPSRWGNPWPVFELERSWQVEQPDSGPKEYDSRAHAHTAATELFRRWLDGDLGDTGGKDLAARRQRILDELSTLRGKDLACYCPTELDCHAEELLRRANQVMP